MGNSLRCCLSCLLPCGALDLIRIVHLNGYVQELTPPITAGEVLVTNPNHILTTPCSQGLVHRILILSPESELKRGNIYFLIPNSSMPKEKMKSRINRKISRKVKDGDVYVKTRSRRDRRYHRSRSWQPHLQSIYED